MAPHVNIMSPVDCWLKDGAHSWTSPTNGPTWISTLFQEDKVRRRRTIPSIQSRRNRLARSPDDLLRDVRFGSQLTENRCDVCGVHVCKSENQKRVNKQTGMM